MVCFTTRFSLLFRVVKITLTRLRYTHLYFHTNVWLRLSLLHRLASTRLAAVRVICRFRPVSQHQAKFRGQGETNVASPEGERKKENVPGARRCVAWCLFRHWTHILFSSTPLYHPRSR